MKGFIEYVIAEEVVALSWLEGVPGDDMKLIKVRLLNGREELLPYYVLDHFIRKRGITGFERSDGWVDIERDPIRKGPSAPFSGDKKRLTDHLVKKRITDHRSFGS